jgi:hypothetical protein
MAQLYHTYVEERVDETHNATNEIGSTLYVMIRRKTSESRDCDQITY